VSSGSGLPVIRLVWVSTKFGTVESCSTKLINISSLSENFWMSIHLNVLSVLTVVDGTWLLIFNCSESNQYRYSLKMSGCHLMLAELLISPLYIGVLVKIIKMYVRTVIRFVWVRAKFGTCTVVSVNGHSLKINCVDSKVNAHILASTSVPITLTMVQVPNLEQTHKKRITVRR
jgi:hypothetical protein